MSPKTILVEDAARDWFKDPEFVAEFEALEAEFAIAEMSMRTSEEIESTKKPSANDP